MIKNAFILNFLKLYNIVWRLAMPLLRKNSRLKQGLEKRISSDHLGRADIWIQAASAGEAYLAVKFLKQFTPDSHLNILVTSMTNQGKEILNEMLSKAEINRHIKVIVEWFPFDIPAVMAQAVDQVSPRVMILLETEIWPALFYYLKQKRTTIAIINARLSKGSFKGYMAASKILKHISPDLICPTSLRDAQRYTKLFPDSRIEVMPNIKFENLEIHDSDPQKTKELSPIFKKELPVCLIASVRKQEEKEVITMISYLKTTCPDQIIALFPRHLHRIPAWEKKLKQAKIPFILRSETAEIKKPCIVLWDIFGELRTAYHFADAVFVGGSLKPLGGQNFIEPAVLGLPTITGPYFDDFAWVGEKIFDQKIVIQAKNTSDASKKMAAAILGTHDRQQAARKAMRYIDSMKGGTSTSCELILEALHQKTE